MTICLGCTVGAETGDWVITSDTDEIPHPALVGLLQRCDFPPSYIDLSIPCYGAVNLGLDFSYYTFNNRDLEEPWVAGGAAFQFHNSQVRTFAAFARLVLFGMHHCDSVCSRPRNAHTVCVVCHWLM